MARDSWLKRLIWLRGSPAGGSGASYEKTVGPAPILSISDAKAKPAKSLVVGMEPIQDLHGYDSPWPAGGNINKLDPTVSYSELTYNPDVGRVLTPTVSTNKWTDHGDGTFGITLGDWVQAGFLVGPLPSGAVYFSFASATGGLRISVFVMDSDYAVKRVSNNRNPITEGEAVNVNTTFSGTDTYLGVYIGGSGQAATISQPYVYAGADASTRTYYPYSNECPITGRTGVTVNHSGADTSDPQTYPVVFPDSAGTVYGGTVDVVSGVLTVTDAEIASYNGETLPSKWISDRDVYAEGTTPTIGAQVVYELATPQTYQLTPTQIQLLKGSNTLWSDADELTLTYLGTTPPNLLGGGYNPPAEQDPEELTEPEATETDEPTKETPAEEGENNGE